MLTSPFSSDCVQSIYEGGIEVLLVMQNNSTDILGFHSKNMRFSRTEVSSQSIGLEFRLNRNMSSDKIMILLVQS